MLDIEKLNKLLDHDFLSPIHSMSLEKFKEIHLHFAEDGKDCDISVGHTIFNMVLIYIVTNFEEEDWEICYMKGFYHLQNQFKTLGEIRRAKERKN